MFQDILNIILQIATSAFPNLPVLLSLYVPFGIFPAFILTYTKVFKKFEDIYERFAISAILGLPVFISFIFIAAIFAIIFAHIYPYDEVKIISNSLYVSILVLYSVILIKWLKDTQT